MVAWTKLDRLTAPTTGFFDFQGFDFSTYPVLQIIGSGIRVTSDQSTVQCVFYKSGPTALTVYAYHINILPEATTQQEESDTAQTEVPLCSMDSATYKVGNDTAEFLSFKMLLAHPVLSSRFKHLFIESSFVNSAGAACRLDGGAMIKDTAAITGFRIAGSSDLTAGKVWVLGAGTS